jgi:hypothetical protein
MGSSCTTGTGNTVLPIEGPKVNQAVKPKPVVLSPSDRQSATDAPATATVTSPVLSPNVGAGASPTIRSAATPTVRSARPSRADPGAPSSMWLHTERSQAELIAYQQLVANYLNGIQAYADIPGQVLSRPTSPVFIPRTVVGPTRV